jgi:alpha-1,2-mannosyltransferase
MRNAGAALTARAPQRRPLLVAVVASLLVAGAISYMVAMNLTSADTARRMADLDVYRTGALSVLHGSQLYDMRTALNLPFTYPPAAAILAVPLTLVPWHAAMLIWLPMVYVPLGIVIFFSFRPLLARAGEYAPAAFAVLLGLCAFLMPLRQELHYGQIDIFLVALCLLDCVVDRPRWPRGALIGLATAIKLVPGVFIVYLLITGRRKAAAVSAATFAAVTGVAWMIAPGDSARYWTHTIYNSRRFGPNAQAANQSLRGMVMRFFFPHVPPVALWVTVVLAAAVLGFAAARVVHERGSEIGGVAITGLLAALLSPVAWIHHLCWIVIALGVIVGDGRNRRRVVTAIAGGALFMTIMPVWGRRLWLSHEAPALVCRLLEDCFGLAAIAAIVVIFRLRDAGPGADAAVPAEPARSAAADGKVLARSRQR